MKLSRFFIMAGLLSVIPLCSCGSDDDDAPEEEVAIKSDFSQLTTPEFVEDCAKYEITDDDSEYSSIELTEGGRYLITRAGSYIIGDYSVSSKNLMSRRCIGAISRAYDDNSHIFGTYDKIGEHTYRLDGFGTIVVNRINDNAVSLTITPDDGSAYTVGARPGKEYDATPETSALCRSWLIKTERLVATYKGNIIVEESGPSMNSVEIEDRFYCRLNSYFPGEFDGWYGDEMAEEVVFTRNGSYICFFDGGDLDVRVWRWKNRAALKLEFSYSIDWSEPDDCGVTTLSFTGHDMTTYDIMRVEINGGTLVLESQVTATEKIDK